MLNLKGNIGAGKTTLVAKLGDRMNPEEVVFLTEPINEWNKVTDDDGITLFENFCRQPDKFAFAFQVMVLSSYLHALKKIYDENPKAKVVIMERSLKTSFSVFAEMLKTSGKMGKKLLINIVSKLLYAFVRLYIYLLYADHISFEVFRHLHETLSLDWEPQVVIYLRTSPKIAFERVRARERSGEENYTIEYLTECHIFHEKMISAHKGANAVYVLDGDIDVDNNILEVLSYIQEHSC